MPTHVIGSGVYNGGNRSPFSPISYPGAELVLLSGVGQYQDVAGATPAVANNDPVGRWNDQSSFARNVTQSTSGNRPLLKTNLVDNRSALLFDGSNDVLRGATASDFTFMHDGTASWTAYVVFRVPTLKPNSQAALFGNNGGASAQRGVTFWYDDLTSVSRDECLVGFITKGGASNGQPVAQRCVASGAWSLGIMQFEPGGAGNDIRIYTESTTAVGSAESINTPYSSSAPTNVIDIGGYGGGVTGAQSVYIADLLIYRGAHSAAVMQQFIDYLTARWKLGRRTAIAATGGSGYNAFPGLVLLSNGNQLLHWRDATTHTSVDGVAKQKISTDGGATWGSSSTVYDDASLDVRDLHGPCQLSGGNVISHFVKWNGAVAITSWVTTSTDNGATWGAPVQVALPSGYNWIFAYGRIRQLSGGTLLLPAYAEKTSNSKTNALLMQSTDGGANWTLRGTIADGSAVSSGYNETDILNTSGTTWLALSRRTDAGADQIWKVTSTDDGVTWGSPSLAFSEGVSPALCDLGGSKILALVGDRVSPTGVRGHVSTDAGSTWSSGCLLYRQPNATQDHGYPSPVLRSDGYVACAFYDEDPSATYGEGVSVVRFYKDLIGA